MVDQYTPGQKITASAINGNFDLIENDIARLDEIDPVPSGIICLWSEEIIPSGWSICNGLNGTPDLRNRFVVGVSESHSLGSTGGEATSTLSVEEIPSHDHDAGTFVAEEGNSHTHQFFQAGLGSVLQCAGGPFWSGHTTINSGSAGAHTHGLSGSTDTTGSGVAHENRPPYYALYYIMKE